MSNMFEKYKIRRYTKEARLIYILADKGLPKLIRTRLRYESADERF